MKTRIFCLLALALAAFAASVPAKTSDGQTKVVLMAGKPSHPARMHEFNAGVQLLAKSLAQGAPKLKVDVILNGWPKDEAVFTDADAIIFYMDGGGKHEAVQEGGARLVKIEQWAKRGVGIGMMHYGVEVVANQAGENFKRLIGGHYENMFSCNPMWEPAFADFPKHPVTRGVKPFKILDEWYFNMRFVDGFTAEKPAQKDGMKFTPILVAKPSDKTRDGPYVHPKGPYPHIQAAKGRPEAMMWVVERPEGGRGMGFTGGHYHDNWGNDDFRKVVLNAIVWLAKAEVPANGIESRITKADLDANLDPKPVKK
jgi:type 1 glutamine amidotransferase